MNLVGKTIAEKYEIQAVVGEGGFAVVYRAVHKIWGRPVALKVFKALGDLPAERRESLVKAFINEGALLADLSERSAAICQARDVGEIKADGRTMPFMVLEWLEGRSLEQVLDDDRNAGLPPRTPEQTLKLLEPAAEALALAHRKGIAHRDVKPANIFILGDPRGEFTVKLLDFGIAKVVQDAQRLSGSFQQTQGVVSSFTPAYGAPEQFSRTHGSTGPWTDVFALALIFTEVITHSPPLRGDDLTQLAFCAMDPKRRPTPRTFGAEVPDALEGVLRRALAVSPDDRFRSMGELWDALRSALAMEPTRAFAGADSQRSSGSPLITQRTPPSSNPSHPTEVAPMTSPMPTQQRPFSQQTLQTSGVATPNPSPSPSRSPLALFAGLGAAVVAAAIVLAGGVWWFKIRGKDPIAPVAATSASASAPIATPPPEPACPAGMTKIPGGKFFMGSDDKTDLDDERPAHQVTLSPYCIDTTEVTVAKYKECSDRGECRRAPRENEWEGIDAASRRIYDPLCNTRDADKKGNHPVNCVDWELASAYCKATGRRLPTEAEWEFATRGSDGRKYPWGDETPNTGDRLNACGKECVAWGKKHPDPDNPLGAMYPADDGFATTAPVGSFPKGASPFGVQDVVGNVWEWVGDWYAPYQPGAQDNPTGPADGKERVMRGGSWNGSDPAWVRPTFRFRSTPTLRSHGIGFRCAMGLVGSLPPASTR